METREVEIFFLAQFLDVFCVLEQYQTIEEMKEDIKIRKRECMKEIEKLKYSQKVK